MEKSCRTSPSVYRCTVAPPTPSAGGQGRHPRESQRLVSSLRSTASGLTTAKREANSSLREATTLTQVSGSTSSGRPTQAARRGECSDPAAVSQLRLPQSQIYLEGGDVCVHVRYENVYAMQSSGA